MLKDKLKGFISGVVVMTLVFGGMTVFAANVTKAINITYRDIKLVIDGAAYMPKDGNGNIVEPFIYNGTTYLPLKAVSNALGKDVTWDGTTSTVYIGGQNSAWMDEMSTYMVDSRYGKAYTESVGNVQNDKNEYARALKLVTKIDQDRATVPDGSKQTATYEYHLGGRYQKLVACMFVSHSYKINPITVKIYGDESLLYTSPAMTLESLTQNIDLNVKNVNSLIIEVGFEVTDISGGWYTHSGEVCLANPQLTN